ncbi:MAG: hypothetical protein ACK4SU_01390 [Dictyoglomus sp.]
MGLIYQPWFIPLAILGMVFLRGYLEKKESSSYEEDAKKYVKVEGLEEKIIPPWRREEKEKKEEKIKKRGIGFWFLNLILIFYVLFVWLLTQRGFSKNVYEIIVGFTLSLYFFYLDIPGYFSNIWTYREYPGGVKGEITLSKHFVFASKKNEAKVFLMILSFYYLGTFSNVILGGILALIIRIWLIDRRLSKITLPDW